MWETAKSRQSQKASLMEMTLCQESHEMTLETLQGTRERENSKCAQQMRNNKEARMLKVKQMNP